MTRRQHTGILVLVLAASLAGCEGSRSPTPTAPSTGQQSPPAPPSPATPVLMTFTDAATKFTTSDVRDAQDQIVQFNSAGELIWTPDGTRLPGYRVELGIYIPCGPCEGWIEVRFGTKDGERRAYLTVDYGHYNPGTLVDFELAGGGLVVRQTDLVPPGTYTLSGVVTEMTPAGEEPLEGASVSRLYGGGWQDATTDGKGFYQIRGLYDRTDTVSVSKEGYQTQQQTVSVTGDTRFDIRLVRR